MFKTFYEDIVVGKETTFGSYTVDKDEVIDFASKYDPQSFHIDEEAAKASVFGALCASGWHTSAMMMRMLVDYMTREGVAGMGSPGIDNLRWLKPVFPGDTLSVTQTTIEKRESKSRPTIGLVKDENTIINQHGEPVMKVISNYMILKKTAG